MGEKQLGMSLPRAACWRYAEFGKAISKDRLEGVKPRMLYYGMINDKQKDVTTCIESEVFSCLV